MLSVTASLFPVVELVVFRLEPDEREKTTPPKKRE